MRINRWCIPLLLALASCALPLPEAASPPSTGSLGQPGVTALPALPGVPLLAPRYHVMAAGDLPIVGGAVDSQLATNPANFAVDGNLSTAWMNGRLRNSFAWAYARVSGTTPITAIRIATGVMPVGTSYDVMTSTNGATWTAVLTNQRNATAGEEVRTLPAPSTGRYVGVYWHNSTTSPQNYFSIYEFAVQSATATPSPTPTPSGSPPAPTPTGSPPAPTPTPPAPTPTPPGPTPTPPAPTPTPPAPTPTPSGTPASATWDQLWQATLALVDADHDADLGGAEPRGSWLERDFAAIDINHDNEIFQSELIAFLQLQARTLPPLDLTGIATGEALTDYLTYVGWQGNQTYRLAGRDSYHTTPTAFNLPYEAFTLTDADGLRLSAWYVPARVATTKSVLLLHGLGSSKDWVFRTYGPWLATKYNVLAFDFRASGASDGVGATLGVKELAEAKLAVAELQRRGSTSIAAMGMSSGGAVAITLGAQTPGLKAVVNDSAYATLYDALLPRGRNAKQPYVELATRATIHTLNRETGLDVESVDPLRWVAQIAPRPFLTLHASGDTATTPNNAQMLYDAAGTPKRLEFFNTTQHAGCYEADPTRFQSIVFSVLDPVM